MVVWISSDQLLSLDRNLDCWLLILYLCKCDRCGLGLLLSHSVHWHCLHQTLLGLLDQDLLGRLLVNWSLGALDEHLLLRFLLTNGCQNLLWLWGLLSLHGSLLLHLHASRCLKQLLNYGRVNLLLLGQSLGFVHVRLESSIRVYDFSLCQSCGLLNDALSLVLN